eukprot:CAMPEP_0169307260 /NCGR_PEP_ID=MMETSP1017-20121227/1203_1 /TAXON_ID=342587 /ORGANISM="Karlodinium micrum, Strain CCMP2283" /LENGTH=49 /DNA_ID=CAMNT_0009400547 /DNA_START=1530 /DNA_END=1678 /DNA_ORIENTATION=-
MTTAASIFQAALYYLSQTNFLQMFQAALAEVGHEAGPMVNGGHDVFQWK